MAKSPSSGILSESSLRRMGCAIDVGFNGIGCGRGRMGAGGGGG